MIAACLLAALLRERDIASEKDRTRASDLRSFLFNIVFPPLLISADLHWSQYEFSPPFQIDFTIIIHYSYKH